MLSAHPWNAVSEAGEKNVLVGEHRFDSSYKLRPLNCGREGRWLGRLRWKVENKEPEKENSHPSEDVHIYVNAGFDVVFGLSSIENICKFKSQVSLGQIRAI